MTKLSSIVFHTLYYSLFKLQTIFCLDVMITFRIKYNKLDFYLYIVNYCPFYEQLLNIVMKFI